MRGASRYSLCVVLTALLAGCASPIQRLGQRLGETQPAASIAVAPSRVEIWRNFGPRALPQPSLSATVNQVANARLEALLGVPSCAAVPVITEPQRALYEHLVSLTIRRPALFATGVGIGPLSQTRCDEVWLLTGRIDAEGWSGLALGVIDGRSGRLLAVASRPLTASMVASPEQVAQVVDALVAKLR